MNPLPPRRPRAPRRAPSRRLSIVATAIAAAAVWLGAAHRTAPPRLDQPDPTPVVEPEPTPPPVHLPEVLMRYDRKAPGPVAAEATGILELLSAAERAACEPSTHAILDGDGDGLAAVLHSADPSDPRLELDLYAGARVRVRGAERTAPVDCPARRAIAVADVATIEAPPGRR
jgi:hypothetical protein